MEVEPEVAVIDKVVKVVRLFLLNWAVDREQIPHILQPQLYFMASLEVMEVVARALFQARIMLGRAENVMAVVAVVRDRLLTPLPVLQMVKMVDMPEDSFV